ncbi:MAG: DUF3108 domain-containing protein [Blastocatellia bacterium]|nr:DUF3108 domain-containing protein [Blastocatellia bacterium]
MIHQFVTRTISGFLLIGALNLFAQPRKTVSATVEPVAETQQSGGQFTPPPKAEPPKPVLNAPASTRPFQVGEKLSFNVSWANFVTAARLELEVTGQGAFFGQQGYQLSTKVATLGYVRTLFNEIDNQYISYIDARTLLPYRTDNATRQGKISEDETVTIDQQRRLARFGDQSELALPSETFDLPSLVYALRLREFGEGVKATKFTALFGKHLVDIEAQVKNRERITTQAGNYDAIRIDLKARTKDKVEYNVRVWFSDDKQRLPLVIQSKPSFGEIRAELTQVSINPQLNKANLIAINTAPPEIVSRDPKIALETAEATPSEFESSLPFAVGERVSYDVEWLNLGNIGKVNLAIQRRGKLDNHVVFEMVGDLATIGSARSIINLDDKFKSYVHVDSLAPIRTETQIIEGQRRKDIVAIYKDNSVRLDNGTHFDVKPRTLDLVSLFYAVRASQLTVGANQTFHFVDANHRPRAVTIKIVKQEAINSALGTRDTLQLDIINQENNQLMAQAWITNDAKRLPLYIVTRLAFGEIRLNIKNVVNGK